MTRDAAPPPRRPASARRVTPELEDDGWGPGAGSASGGRSRGGSRSRGRSSLPHLGPFELTPLRVVIALAFLGSAAYISYAILVVRDTSQIPMLSSGFAVLGLACATVALWLAIGMWRAANDARSGRALILAIFGGSFGLAAIGCFTLTAVLALLWKG